MSRGFVTTWETKIDHTPRLWEEFQFPVLTGTATFKVVELRGNHVIVESGNLRGRIVQNENGEWVFKHNLIDKNMMVPIRLEEVDAPPPPMNPNIGFSKSYK
jgi:hypothetical protein